MPEELKRYSSTTTEATEKLVYEHLMYLKLISCFHKQEPTISTPDTGEKE